MSHLYIRRGASFLLAVAGALVFVACAPSGGGTGSAAGRSPTSNTGGGTGGSGGSGGGGGGTGGNTCATSAQIRTFNENPRTASGNAALPFTNTLLSSYTTVSTLSGLSGNCNALEAPKLAMGADTFFPSYVVRPNGGSLQYSPTTPEFRQLNAFFNANNLLNFVRGLGSSLASMGTLKLNAHCNEANNAYFQPGTGNICLGFVDVGGGKKVWAADDADVTIHEVGHGVNHALSSTTTMNSTHEAGAIDEGIADYWALTLMNDARLSEWFLGAIGPAYIRDATQNIIYPTGLRHEIHDDSRILSQTLWALRDSGSLGRAKTDQLVRRAMSALVPGARFNNFYREFYDAASGPGYSGADLTFIQNAFAARGLHRADVATGMTLSSSVAPGVKQVYVVDDHAFPFQQNGNCDGTLDVGETALVIVNLENPNATPMGVGVATLGAPPAGVTVPSGGEIGEYFRFGASQDFTASLPTAGTDNRIYASALAGFVVRATTPGVKNFSFTFRPLYSDPTLTLPTGADVTVNFSLTVASGANSTSCTNWSLWP